MVKRSLMAQKIYPPELLSSGHPFVIAKTRLPELYDISLCSGEQHRRRSVLPIPKSIRKHGVLIGSEYSFQR
jgi:hypothetical protein